MIRLQNVHLIPEQYAGCGAGLFSLVADDTGAVDQSRLGLLLQQCVQIPRQLGESTAFGGNNVQPSVYSCFQQVHKPPFLLYSPRR